ncbi:MAG TPA: polysaccharide pyruvyl transferase family protein [Terriglobales bacterium]|jgi:polysaccharide pyruvyl transferase WcaK-like protein
MISKSHRCSPSIALLTPYDGANFGDAAIQDALIENFRKNDPDATFVGVTLNPDRTAEKHNIPCFPLAAISRPHYRPARKNGTWANTRLSRLPVLKQFAAAMRELRHVRESYQILRKVDVLAVAGGGQLDEEWGGPWGHPYSLFKWARLASLAGCPVVFLSVGACRMDSWLSKWFLKRALSSAAYRSYRDQGSKQLALALTPRAEGPVVPDIAFSLPVEKYKPVMYSGSSTPIRVALSPIAYAHPNLWPTANAIEHERYLTELASFTSQLLKSGVLVTLFSSSSPDELIFPELRKRLDSDLTEADHNRLSSRDVGSHHELLELLNSVDYVVSSRLHALLLAFLVNKPAIAISYDRKVTSLMEDMGQASYCFDIKSYTRYNLASAFSDIQTNRQLISSKLSAIRRGYRSALQVQYQVVCGLFSRPKEEKDITGRASSSVDAKMIH